jgi:hypothetical protein
MGMELDDGELTVWATEMRSQPMEVAFREPEVVERDILCSVVLVCGF